MKTYFFDVITKHYLDFTGRANRKQFWLWILWVLICSMVVAVISWLSMLIIARIFGIAILLPHLAICMRRIKDAGFKPYWGLLLIPSLVYKLEKLFSFDTGLHFGIITGICIIVLLFIFLKRSKGR